MKICLLQADKIPSCRQKYSGGDYPDMFKNFFNMAECNIEIDTYDVTDFNYPNDLNNYDAYLISGSVASPCDEKAWIYTLKTKITEIISINKKIIGICFGHQILAQVLGGKVERMTGKYIFGNNKINIVQNKSWMVPYKDCLNLLFNHQDHVTELPGNLELIASSSGECKIQLFVMNNQILGIQAHPEMLPKHNYVLIESYSCANLNKEAIKSLDCDNDSSLLCHWIINFLRQQ